MSDKLPNPLPAAKTRQAHFQTQMETFNKLLVLAALAHSRTTEFDEFLHGNSSFAKKSRKSYIHFFKQEYSITVPRADITDSMPPTPAEQKQHMAIGKLNYLLSEYAHAGLVTHDAEQLITIRLALKNKEYLNG